MMQITLIILLVLISYTICFPIILIRISSISGKPFSPLPKEPEGPCDKWPRVSILVPIHKNASILTKKLIDISKLEYPDNLIEVLIIVDGDVAGLKEALKEYREKVGKAPELRIIYCQRVGKNIALTKGAKEATGDIFLITDVDARLDSLAVKRLISVLGQEDIGGGCGQHVITSSRGAQNVYWDMEAKMKSAEMDLFGSITSAYGTMLAIKRHLFVSVPPGVTDDHFLALSVVARKFRFVYVPESKVFITKPSRTLLKEIERRRRIVTQSFYSLIAWRHLLNPINHGWYAVCLISHKLLRRFLPVFFLIVFGISLWLCVQGSKVAEAFVLLQAVLYVIVCISFIFGISGTRLSMPFRVAAYFFAGNIGIFLGIIDFLRGKKVVTW